jgi:RNA recognition motif-containing protein
MYVENLSLDANPYDLLERFEQYGQVESTSMVSRV